MESNKDKSLNKIQKNPSIKNKNDFYNSNSQKLFNNNKNIDNSNINKVKQANFNKNSQKGTKDNSKIIFIKKKRRFPGKFKKNFSKKSEYFSEIIDIKRIVKVVKGGRRFKFSVLMVIGNKKGKVGFGIGKANEIPIAAKKARNQAEKNVVEFKYDKEHKTLPHEIIGKFCASKIIMLPAKTGSGLKAGGSARILLSLSGIENIKTKAHGSRNKLNLIKATINGLVQLRLKEDIDKLRFSEN